MDVQVKSSQFLGMHKKKRQTSTDFLSWSAIGS